MFKGSPNSPNVAVDDDHSVAAAVAAVVDVVDVVVGDAVGGDAVAAVVDVVVGCCFCC